jgi:uncharacterized membrane protein
MRKFDIKFIASSAIIAALYVALTWLLAPISYGSIQFRISEILVLLVFFNPKYALAIILGTFISNTTSSLGWYDMVFGTLATTLSVFVITKCKNVYQAALAPVVFNGVIVALELYIALKIDIWLSLLFVSIGEAVVLFLIGIPVMNSVMNNEALLEGLNLEYKEIKGYSKVNIINTELATLDSRVDNQLAGVESRLNTQITDINKNVQQQAETLAEVQDKVNDLDIELEGRIIEKVSDSHIAINENLLGITTAITQINLTLEQLKAGSGHECPGDSEQLSLLVEQLTELQRRISNLEKADLVTDTEIAQVNTELTRLAASLNSGLNQLTESFSKTINSVDVRLSKANSDLLNTVNSNNTIINDKLAAQAADDLLLYQVIYRIKDELLAQISSVQNALQANIDTNLAIVNQRITATETKVASDIAAAQEAFGKTVDAAKTALSKDITDINKLHGAKISENADAISNLSKTVADNQAKLVKDLDATILEINANKVNITNKAVTINQ